MLLPEAFLQDPKPQALLAFDEAGRRLLAAAAYHFLDRELFLRGLRVIRTHRRSGLGSALIGHLDALARERSLTRIVTHADTLTTPELDPFLTANGFAGRGRLWVAHVDAPHALGLILPLRARLMQSGRVPDSACVVHPADAPMEEAAELCAAEMESEWSVHPAFFRASVYRKDTEYSAILMVEGHVAGLLIVEWAPGDEIARVTAHVVAPAYRRGWANIFLLATALELGAGAGIRKVRFESLDDNLDTVNLIQRLGGEMVRATTRFERPVMLA